MRRWQKRTAWSMGGLLALLLLVIGALLVIGNTDSGRNFIIRMTSRLTQGHVQIAGIHGSFPASLQLDRLQLADDDGIWLFAEHISLRWTPSHLLFRHITVDSLHVGRLHMERTPLPEKQQKPTKTPSIPYADLARLTIDRLELGKALVGEPASLQVEGTAHLRSLQEMTAQVTARRTGGNGNYSAQLRFDPAINRADDLVGGEQHDDIGGRGSIFERCSRETVGFNLRPARRNGAEADDHLGAAVLEVQRLRAALVAVADDRHALAG